MSEDFAPVLDALDGTLLSTPFQSRAGADGGGAAATDEEHARLLPEPEPRRSHPLVADQLLPDLSVHTGANALRHRVDDSEELVVEVVSPPPDAANSSSSSSHGARRWHRLQADSGFWTIDFVRAFGLLCTALLTYNQRLTYMSNPVARFFGGDWCACLFFFGCGCRCASDFYHFQKRVASNAREQQQRRAAHKRQAAQSAVFSLMTVVFTLLYVVVVFGPTRVCASEILITIGLCCLAVYPLHYAPTWAVFVLGVAVVVASPALFFVTGGEGAWANGYYATDWSARGVLGCVVFFGLFPLFPYVGYVMLGMVLMRCTLCHPRDSPSRRTAALFVGLVLVPLGLALQNTAAEHPSYASDWRKYFFASFSTTPVSLSLATFSVGFCTILVVSASTIFDPPPCREQKQQQEEGEEQEQPSKAMAVLRDVMSRTSYFVSSMYYVESTLIFGALRIAGRVRFGDADHLLLPPKSDLLLSRDHEAWANVLSVVLGLAAMCVSYGLLYAWDRFGRRGFLTCEHMSAYLACNVVPRLFFASPPAPRPPISLAER